METHIGNRGRLMVRRKLVRIDSESGDTPEYEATITADLYDDFSVGRWLWVFQDLRRVEPILINGRQGVWTLPAAIGAQLESE